MPYSFNSKVFHKLPLLESRAKFRDICSVVKLLCCRKRKQFIITFIVMLLIKALVGVIMLIVVAKPAFLGLRHISTSVATVAAERKVRGCIVL